jgi:hypothetical protein
VLDVADMLLVNTSILHAVIFDAVMVVPLIGCRKFIGTLVIAVGCSVMLVNLVSVLEAVILTVELS